MKALPVTLAFIVGGLAFPQEMAPHVVSAGREWRQGTKTLTRNAALEPRTLLTGAMSTGDLILDCGNRGAFLYHCLANGCSAPPCAETDSVTSRVSVHRLAFPGLTDMFTRLTRREPAELAVAGVRGSAGPSDAVVMQTPQGVHWAPALARVLEGRYCFRLSHLPISPSNPTRIFTLDWDRAVEKEGIATVPNLAPGLYAIEKGSPETNASCRPDPNSAPAWVLVAPQSNFQVVNKRWDDNLSQIDDLEQSGASTSALSALRHAILASLADSIEGK